METHWFTSSTRKTLVMINDSTDYSYSWGEVPLIQDDPSSLSMAKIVSYFNGIANEVKFLQTQLIGVMAERGAVEVPRATVEEVEVKRVIEEISDSASKILQSFQDVVSHVVTDATARVRETTVKDSNLAKAELDEYVEDMCKGRLNALLSDCEAKIDKKMRDCSLFDSI
jgi:hypothetical protein